MPKKQLRRIHRRAHGGAKGEDMAKDKWAELDAQALLEADEQHKAKEIAAMVKAEAEKRHKERRRAKKKMWGQDDKAAAKKRRGRKKKKGEAGGEDDEPVYRRPRAVIDPANPTVQGLTRDVRGRYALAMHRNALQYRLANDPSLRKHVFSSSLASPRSSSSFSSFSTPSLLLLRSLIY